MKLIIDIEPRYCKDMQSDVKELYYEAINRITEAVRHGTPYEERPQGDLISRDYVEKIVISEMVDLQDGTEIWRTYVNDTCESILNKVHNAPAVDVIPNEEGYEMYGKGYLQGYERGKNERAKGGWIEHSCYKDVIICSNCNSGSSRWHEDFKFCPNCGADMRGAENEADN